ncbi:poly(R)-hydroxyalkanoic acid synthase subunit PhaE [uncultured Neptuniibacter sp.]|uniref:poly(R)-hydroxyalkanoic acid synthase subunit PhaE n=1 Tax=uncultured Neptuniibacter sp. TaxID=502143 RepID=UPI00260387E1|nr:poly(R)-hydroxyalkanoic acid synthase subunit PhaE [uncultured Neptuniibacter sp.]
MEKSTLSLEALLEAQKEYWDKFTSGTDIESPEKWAEQLSNTQKQFRENAPQQFSQLLDILGAQSSNFTQYGEELLKQYREGSEIHLNEAVSNFQKYMQQQTGDALMQQWQLPEQFASLFKTHSFRDDLLFENPFISGMKSLLETPVIGGNREAQEQIREATKLTIEYQEALQEYITHYNTINQSAASKMLQTLTHSEEKVDGLQKLHDIWVDAYESAYSDTVFTDAYQRSHGRISNALMQLRKYVQDVRDIHFQSVGLATRKGLDTALQRQHQLRKEMRVSRREVQGMKQSLSEMQNELMTETVAELKKELATLKKEVASLKKQIKEA